MLQRASPFPRKTPSFPSLETGVSTGLRKTAVDGLATTAVLIKICFAEAFPGPSADALNAPKGCVLDRELASYSALGGSHRNFGASAPFPSRSRNLRNTFLDRFPTSFAPILVRRSFWRST